MTINFTNKKGKIKSYRTLGKDCRNYAVGQDGMQKILLHMVELKSMEDTEKLIQILEIAKLSFLEAEDGSKENFLELLRRTD